MALIKTNNAHPLAPSPDPQSEAPSENPTPSPPGKPHPAPITPFRLFPTALGPQPWPSGRTLLCQPWCSGIGQAAGMASLTAGSRECRFDF